MSERKEDLFHRVCNWVSYNRYLAIGLVVGCIAAYGLVGCQMKTQSLKEPTKQVTATELKAEVADKNLELEKAAADLNVEKAKVQAEIEKYNANVTALNKQVQARQEDLAKKEQIRAEVLQAAGGLITTAVTGGTVTPGAAVGTVLQMLSLAVAGGAVLDNRRKDKKIAEQRSETAAATEPATPTEADKA